MKHNLVVDTLSGHDTKGKVGKINKKAGDAVNPGDILFTIESGKGTYQYKSQFKGKIEKLDINEGDAVEKGQIVGIIEGEPEYKNDKVKKAHPENAVNKAVYSFGIKPLKKTYQVDVAVVGGGPGGYVAAIRAAQGGKKVLLIEEERLGGTCLNWGCIPTKAIVSSIQTLERVKNAGLYGIQVDSYKVSIEKIINRKNEIVDKLVSGIEYLLQCHQVEHIKGKADAENRDTLIVKNKSVDAVIKFQKLILATGSKNLSLPVEGFEDDDILTSRELLNSNSIPDSLAIIGGGVIGMEFAFIYQALGSKVTVVEYAPQIIGTLDEDVAAVVKAAASNKGIKILEQARAVSIKNTIDGKKIVEIEQDDKSAFLSSDKVAVAVGRKANLGSISLEKLGVELNEKKDGIQVDEYMRTSNPNIYAIGDVTNKVLLAHVASHQGITAADHINGKAHKISYDRIPSAIFTAPEIGQVGLSEREARARGLDVLIGIFPLMANGKAQTMGETEGFVKLIAEKKTRLIIGGTVIGAHGADLISVICNLMESGTPVDTAINVIYAHPTLSESIHEALLDLDNRGIHFAG